MPTQKCSAFWKKYRRAVLCAFLAAALLFVFFCVWWVGVLPAHGKSLSARFSDDYSATTPVLEQQLRQEFSTDQPLYDLALVFQLPGGQPQGELTLRLLNAHTNEELSRSTGQMGNILPGQYTGLGLDTPVAAGAAQRYALVLEPHYQTDARLALGCSSQPVPDAFSLVVDDAQQPGALALALGVGRIGSFVSRFYWAVALFLTLLGCGVYLLATGPWKGSAHLHRLYALCAAGLGLAFCLVLPPYAAPDEQFHINQAFSNAARLSTYLDGDGWHLQHIPLATSWRRPSDIDPLVQDQNTTVFTWQAVTRQLTSRSPDSFGAVQEFEGALQADTNSSLYLASTLGVFLGFCLRLGFVPCLLLGRLFNLAAFVALTTWAIRKAPFGKTIFMGAALLPMTLHQAVSFSRDSLVLGLAFCYTALCLDAAFGPHTVLSWKKLLPLALTGLVLAPAKAVYLPLTALCLLIPAARLGAHARLKQAGFLALCCLVFFTGSTRYLLGQLFQAQPVTSAEPAASSVVEVPPSAEAEALPAPAEPQPVDPDSICFTPGYMLSHPGLTVQLVIRSVIEQGDHYIKTLVGGSLSYYSLELGWGWVLVCYGLLALCTLGQTGEAGLPRLPRIWVGLLALACFGLAVLGCITWTPTYYQIIYGLQGRYFLPALPALLLALRPKNGPLRRSDGSGLTAAMTLMNAGFLLNAMLGILAR